jgi:hypothetical protein
MTAVSKTRRSKKKSTAPLIEPTPHQPAKTMSIPQLRRAFEELEKATHHILKTKSKENRVEAFQAAWKRIFMKPVSTEAAREYLAYQESHQPPMTQKGGAATLDWTLGPGASSPHGHFLEYVSNGFDFYNRINLDSFRAACGTENTTPQLPKDLGSNQVGGAKAKKATRRKQKGGMARLVYGAVPPGPLHDFAAASRAQPAPTPSPSAVDNPNLGKSILMVPNLTASITA